MDNVCKDLNVVRHVLKGHGVPRWTHSRWGSAVARRDISESVRRKVHEERHSRPLGATMWKLVRLLKVEVGV